MASIECGIFESLSGSPDGRDAVDYPALIRKVRHAEDAGYGYYFIIEHQSTTYPGVTARILTHPVAGLDGYKEMMRLLEEKEALKVYVNVAE